MPLAHQTYDSYRVNAFMPVTEKTTTREPLSGEKTTRMGPTPRAGGFVGASDAFRVRQVKPLRLGNKPAPEPCEADSPMLGHKRPMA